MKNLTLFFVFFLVAFLSIATMAQDPSIVAKFVARSHSFQGVTLPYRLFIPDNYSPSQKYPLVLTLAGSSFGGTDNIRQLLGGPLATAWADSVNQAKYPYFVVSPQSPTGDWTENVIVGTVSDLLDSLTREFTIDPNRWYVTGASAGGIGVWDMITRFPDRFAAGIPISGGGSSDCFTHCPYPDLELSWGTG
jgi:predicted peptidase